MNKTRLEIMVGFFVLLAITILFIIIFFISGVYFLREGYTIQAHYEYIASLEKGAPVRIAGVRVGEVNDVTIEYDTVTRKPIAVAQLWIQADTEIRSNAELHIFGTLALNETYIEIIAGDEEARLLQDGDSIRGVDPVPMELLLEEGSDIIEDLEEFADKLNKVLGDEETQKAIHSLIIDMSELTGYFNQMVKDQGGDINDIVDNLEQSLERLNVILENVEAGEGTVGQLLMKDELYEEMKSLIREIKMHPWRLLKKDRKSSQKKKFLFF